MSDPHKPLSHTRYTSSMSGNSHKTFYLETFGCQMNVHDSEKVIGTLVQQGYSPGRDRRRG